MAEVESHVAQDAWNAAGEFFNNIPVAADAGISAVATAGSDFADAYQAGALQQYEFQQQMYEQDFADAQAGHEARMDAVEGAVDAVGKAANVVGAETGMVAAHIGTGFGDAGAWLKGAALSAGAFLRGDLNGIESAWAEQEQAYEANAQIREDATANVVASVSELRGKDAVADELSAYDDAGKEDAADTVGANRDKSGKDFENVNDRMLDDDLSK